MALMPCPPCTHNCAEGRECPARAGMHQQDGGHTFNRGVSFPFEGKDEVLITPEETSAWTVFAQVLLVLITVGCLAGVFLAYLKA